MWDLDTIHKMNSPEGIERQRRHALALNGKQLEFEFMVSKEKPLFKMGSIVMKDMPLVDLHAYEKDLNAELEWFETHQEENEDKRATTLQGMLRLLNTELSRRYQVNYTWGGSVYREGEHQ